MSSVRELLKPLPGAIEPRWWTGTAALPPESFTIDCSNFSMDDSDLDGNGLLATEMKQRFHDVGLVYLVNTGLDNLQSMRLFAKLVLQQEAIYMGGANPRDSLEPNVYEVGAPLSAHLHYHHEMAYLSKSTRMLAFLSHKAFRGGGYTQINISNIPAHISDIS